MNTLIKTNALSVKPGDHQTSVHVLRYCQVVYPKADEQRQRLNDAVKHILLFRSLEEVRLVRLSVCLSVSHRFSLSLSVSLRSGWLDSAWPPALRISCV